MLQRPRNLAVGYFYPRIFSEPSLLVSKSRRENTVDNYHAPIENNNSVGKAGSSATHIARLRPQS